MPLSPCSSYHCFYPAFNFSNCQENALLFILNILSFVKETWTFILSTIACTCLIRCWVSDRSEGSGPGTTKVPLLGPYARPLTSLCSRGTILWTTLTPNFLTRWHVWNKVFLLCCNVYVTDNDFFFFFWNVQTVHLAITGTVWGNIQWI